MTRIAEIFRGGFFADKRGVALLEFAFTLPVVLGIGCYGVEMCNLALLNLKISQIALNLADNASRVGTYTTLSTQQLREIDIEDILDGVREQGQGIQLTTRGRVTVSSLENVQQSYDTAPVQRIHWQRCVGQKGSAAADSDYRSTYGTTTTSAGSTALVADAGTTTTDGMGDTGAKVTAPSGAGVMFVEINYQTKPLFGTWLAGATRIHYIASFIVRDRRDFSQMFNPTPAVASGAKLTCDRYTA